MSDKKVESSTREIPRRLGMRALLWQIPLACFILAGLTGFLYRLGLVGVNLWGLSLENIRHAHSHLMFFCWVVPLPMYYIIGNVKSTTTANASTTLMIRMALVTLVLGLASYPFFLGYGYRPVAIAGLDLPLSVILSGLVMLGWYGFMAGYWKARKYLTTDLSGQFYDGALLMLFFSSLGAWGVAVVQFSGVQNPLLGKALTHFFLATFTEGWVVLALLGVIYQQLDINRKDIPFAPGLLVGLIMVGAPLTFPYGISEGLLSQHLLLAARAGGAMAAIGLGLNLYVIIRGVQSKGSWFLKVIGGLLALKFLAQLVVSIFPAGFWMSEHALRILYLHILLLGVFTLTMIYFLHTTSAIPDIYFSGVVVSVLTVIFSLLLPTRLWPGAWGGIWIYYVLTTVAVLPVVAVLVYAIKIVNSKT